MLLLALNAAATPAPPRLLVPAVDVPAAPAPPAPQPADSAGAAISLQAPAFGEPIGVVHSDSLDGLPIARVVIDARNIFDPLPEGRLRPVLALANRLHVRTREQTIREQLLFARGQRWTDAVGHETARRLRSLDFLVPSHIDAERTGDSVLVTVATRDVWSTNPEFNIESGGGKRYGSLALRERNFLGLGKGFSFSVRDLPGGKSRGIEYHDPSLQGTRIQVQYAASDGTSGASDQLLIGQPFYAEDAPRTYGFEWNRTTWIATMYAGPTAVSSFNRGDDSWDVYWGSGRRTGKTIRRVIGMWESRGRRFGPSEALVPDPPPEYTGGEESLVLHRVTIEGVLWRPHYVERVRINGFGLVEDFDVGPSATVAYGYAPKLFGSSQDEGYARARLATGLLTSLGFGTFWASGSTRIQNELLETVLQGDARWYAQGFGQTLVLAAHGVSGEDVARDFEVAFGGLNGLRAYPVTAVTGTQAVRLNAETRWMMGERFWESLTLGMVAFTDAARAWGPGSGASDWHVAAGAGIRAALPQWSLGQVIRIDLAWPLSPAITGPRQPVLSFGSSQAF